MRIPANASLLLASAQQAPFAIAVPALSATLNYGPSTFTAAGAFPTNAWKNYYNSPTQTTEQVQPIVTDPVLNKVYPFNLTDPHSIPKENTVDEHLLPPPAPKPGLLAHALLQIDSIVSSENFPTPCSKCLGSLEIAKFLSLAAPELGPDLAVEVCTKYGGGPSREICASTYGIHGIGAIVTQVVSFADVGGYDGQMLCHNFLSLCPLPPPAPLDLDNWFAKPKPNPLPVRQRSGERVKVLHLSDFHLDPRYMNGAEAACNSGLCCREGAFNSTSPDSTVFPAPRFGAWRCDTPLALAMAALEAIPVLAGTEKTGFAWSLYTGDLVAHDSDNQLSRDYVMYTEAVVYDLMRRYLGSGPMYAALGNHDSNNQAQDSPHALGGKLENQYSWNYDHIAALWAHESWLPSAAVASARAHYGGYSVRRADGLRVITLNTDMWYRANWFAYINMTADTSGMLRFLTDELQEAEDVGEKVWIVGHVLTGWDGSNPLVNPTELFYQIVDRFSPHVIANIFFGHTHEDQLSIFYSNNATVQSAETAQAVAWIGPALAPITGLNSGFRVYEVDTGTFEVIDAHTWVSNVSHYAALEGQTEVGPTYEYEYSARKAYGKTIAWGANEPLNATWWHRVTEAMEADPSLVQTFTQYQGKSSDRIPPCTSAACVEAKICYIRSGSASIAKQNCKLGFGSVQGWP